MKTAFEITAAVLSYIIAVIIITKNAVPWLIIAIYWSCVAMRNIINACERKR